MFCKNCGKEIDEKNKYCPYCGSDTTVESGDLKGVTKISTPLFIIFDILTCGIYGIIKTFRITGDIRKIVPREQTVSPAVITACFLLGYMLDIQMRIVMNSGIYQQETVTLLTIFGLLIFLFVQLPMFCHIIYHTLKNIAYIAEVKQGKKFKYSKFWAFIFNILYINFVLNTYDKRLM